MSSDNPESTASDELTGRVRDVHRTYPTGVSIVTTLSDGVPVGLVCNAFSSVSLDPPLVLVCVNTASHSHEHLHRGDHIGLNFLAHDQEALARQFAQSGGEKFAGIDWSGGEVTGVPVLRGVASHLETAIESRIPAGTHTIFLCRVLAAAAHDRAPLVYLAGEFFDGGRLHPYGS